MTKLNNIFNDEDNDETSRYIEIAYKEGFIDGYYEAVKKFRCCGTCKHIDSDNMEEPCYSCSALDGLGGDKWEADVLIK